MRRPVTLTARLVVMAVGLVVVSAVVIGLVATLGTRAVLVARLDQDLTQSQRIIQGPPGGDSRDGDRAGDVDRDGGAPPPGDFRGGPGTVTASWTAGSGSGQISGQIVVADDRRLRERALGGPALEALRDLPVGRGPQDLDLPGLGSYRAAVVTGPDGTTEATALPLDDVEAVLGRLVGLEVLLTTLVALAAAGAGTVLVRRQLRPLREVAGTAHAVAALPLSSGEIDLDQRVPRRLTDERTEVGRVGSALNTLLAHVEDSLGARQRSEQQVRQFVADASHELRTPLATIAGYTELARRRPDDDGAVRTALGKVEDEAARMTALVEDLLLLARLDSGRPLERHPVDLSRLLVEAVADAQVVAPDHRWRLSLPEEPVEVLGDERRLHQVVTNLLTNARKYTPPGTVVTVTAGPGGFSVHDDGPGFAPEVAARAFERFVRADPARHRGPGWAGRGTVGASEPGTPGGVGLGLSLVRAVVAAHDGTVELRSAPGDTTLEVALPAEPTSGR